MSQMSYLLRKKPDLKNKSAFRLMMNWADVADSDMDRLARKTEDKSNFEEIALDKTGVRLFSFLRYDYKKVLIRTRWLYIDRFCNSQTMLLQPTDELDVGFFEPVLICFPAFEFLGRIKHVSLYRPSDNTKDEGSTKIINQMLVDMSAGYEECSHEITKIYRHSLAHELRPESLRDWECNLCTEILSANGDSYAAPILKGEQVQLNVPHLIDSCIDQLEQVCESLENDKPSKYMNNFCEYWRKRRLK